MSGVTAPTMRHYDATGLLPPVRIGAGGHRCYEDRQLLRLQQILVLRALCQASRGDGHRRSIPARYSSSRASEPTGFCTAP